MTDPENVPADANEECVGPQSEQAGKASSCQGCPNASSCASGANKGPDPNIALINDTLSVVKRKIVVLSGKGGVGKSTVSTQLSMALANWEKIQKNRTQEHAEDDDDDDDEEEVTQVGLLDVDLCGPSLPTMLGLTGKDMTRTNLGMVPCYYQDNLGVISIGFAIDKEAPVIWRGPKKNGLIVQFLRDVYWGDKLDYLVIDTPPGTSDEHLTIVNYLKQTLDGAVIVTTPQDVALTDVRREIDFCRKTKIPILGIVENMSGFVCPSCKTESQIFRATSGGGRALAKECGIPFLGAIPLDPQVMEACETGKCVLTEHPHSETSKAFKKIVENLLANWEEK
uniref:Cytosolic Fe-S cluster assembly factor NUBP1 homolog n=1 Tax=Percolomonas cosmopolitus TaxID=63605 RepID=A0A7S1KU35_9EUKA